LWEVIEAINVWTSLGLFVKTIFLRSYKTSLACLKIKKGRNHINLCIFVYISTNFYSNFWFLKFRRFSNLWEVIEAINVWTSLGLFVEKNFPRSHKNLLLVKKSRNVKITLNRVYLCMYRPIFGSNVWFLKFMRFSNLWEVIEAINVWTSLGLFVKTIFLRSYKTSLACLKIKKGRNHMICVYLCIYRPISTQIYDFWSLGDFQIWGKSLRL